VGDSSFMRFSFRITIVSSAIVIIISFYSGVLTSDIINTFYLSTSINPRAFVIRISAAVFCFTCVYSTWIIIIAVDILVVAPSTWIAEVVGTFVIIIATFFGFNTAGVSVARINGTSTIIHTNNWIINTSSLFRYANISGTFASIIANYSSIDTTFSRFTGINGTRISVITIYFREVASFSGRASIVCT
jgi:hypothetical protein